MIYSILKTLIKLTLWFYFNKKKTIGKENIPEIGPVLLVANHPSTFMDPLLVALSTKRKVHFLAKGAMFKNGIIKWIFKQFNMIPVYRRQDDPSQMGKNHQTFEKCFDHLQKDGVLLIFPEGISITENKLKPIKTGAARITLGTLSTYPELHDIPIIPIGLHYEDPHTFRKNVLISIGKPISSKNFQILSGNERIAVKDLTQEIANRLSELSMNIASKEEEQVVQMVHELYNKETSLTQSFENEKEIANVINYFAKSNYPRFYQFKKNISKYFSLAESNNLDNIKSRNSKGFFKGSLNFTVTSILFIPISIYGLIHNFIPFLLTPHITRLITKTYEYKGPLNMSLAMVLYLIQYSLLSFLFFHLSGSGIFTFIYSVSLPLTGLVTYFYWEALKRKARKVMAINLFLKKEELVLEIIKLRDSLVSEIEIAHEEYLGLVSE